jgi:excisionase family DNA binding protein
MGAAIQQEEIETEFLNAKQVAKKIGMSLSYVHLISKSGELKSYMFGNKSMFKPEDVNQWVKSQVREGGFK